MPSGGELRRLVPPPGSLTATRPLTTGRRGTPPARVGLYSRGIQTSRPYFTERYQGEPIGATLAATSVVGSPVAVPPEWRSAGPSPPN